ncbi:MAG: hypothetical protein GX442_10170 [Candidatus Riflebacteria bacterium]|nr:hypothetical protein [Candidatus Riflebacteria bacterium]
MGEMTEGPGRPTAPGTGRLRQVVLVVVWLGVAAGFWPAAALVAGFVGLDRVAEVAWQMAPALTVGDQRLDEAVTAIRVRRRLEGQGNGRLAGEFWLAGPAGLDLEAAARAVTAAVASLGARLGPIPLRPAIVLQELGSSEGSFQDFFRLAVDPTRDDPGRVIVHELVHLHLLWALLPGLPVDCPRWFNEGMAEELSAAIALVSQGKGPAAGDVEAGRDLVPAGGLVPLERLSAAFSGTGAGVEVQARHAFRQLRERVGEEGIGRLVRGLRRGRSFRSVLLIEGRMRLEDLADSFGKRLREGFAAERLPPAEMAARLAWQVTNRPGGRTADLIRALVPVVGPATAARLLERLGMAQAELCLRAGRVAEAVGRLAPLARAGVPGAAAALAAARRQGRGGLTENGQGRGKDPAETCGMALPPRPVRQEPLGWGLALAASGGFLWLYPLWRARVNGWAAGWWEARSGRALAGRWAFLLGTAFGGAWFLRLLVVGFLPYAGFDGLDDLGRILVAELLVVLVWLGLAVTFRRFDGGADGSGPGMEGTPTTARPVDGGGGWLAVALVVTAWLPAVVAAGRDGWRPAGVAWTEPLLAVLVNVAASLAFAGLFGPAARRWEWLFPGRGAQGLAVAYVLFRGGLGGDSGAWVFALVLGWWLAGRVAAGAGRVGSLAGWDLACVLPHVLLTAGWFPAQDPVGGWFTAGPAPWWAWAAPVAVLVALIRRMGREAAR